MRSVGIAVIGAAIGAIASPVGAAVTTYTTQASFDAAITAETTFGFDEGGSADNQHLTTNPYTQSGITFADNITAANAADGKTPILVLVGAQANPYYGTDFLTFQNPDLGISADITASGVNALGFTFATYVAGGPATISVNGGTPEAIDVTGTVAFIGFVSSAPITDVSVLFPIGFSFDVTSVSYGTGLPASVPEPASWAMMLGGFGIVGGALRRRRAKAAFA